MIMHALHNMDVHVAPLQKHQMHCRWLHMVSFFTWNPDTGAINIIGETQIALSVHAVYFK